METVRRSKRLKQKRDMLSDLPNEILLHIMSFMMIQDVVKTSILSKRWESLWEYLPDFTLHTSKFSNPDFFCKFVSGLMKRRSWYPTLLSLDFNDDRGYLHPMFLSELLHRYEHFDMLQHLKIIVSYNFLLPHFIFSFQYLTSLQIRCSPFDIIKTTRVPEYLDLPALVNLCLEFVGISADKNGHANPFSTCKMLKTLKIEDCCLIYPKSLSRNKLGVLNITNSTLTNLTIIDYDSPPADVIDPPIPRYKYVISAPKLSSFILNDSPFRTSHGQRAVTVEIHSSSLM